MDFFERQHQAKSETKKLVALFVLAVLLIIALLNGLGFYVVNLSQEHQITAKDWLLSPISLGIAAGTILTIFIGSLFRYWQVRGGGQAVAEMVAGRRIDMDSKDPQERRLVNVVEEMSIASGMSVPTIYVMDHEPGLNAFVAGLIPSDTVLMVTKGLLDNLSRQELQGVVAHEFSHIFHADMRINLRLIGILGGILAIGQLGYYILRSLRYSGSRRSSSSSNNNGGQLILFLMAMSIALIIVGYVGVFFGRLIKAAISRQREYLADAAAVQYSRDSMGISNALYKIKTNGKHSLLDSSHAEDMSHMCFGQAIQIKAFSGMLATHPPIDDRIQALVPGYRSIRRQMDEEVIDDLSPIAQFAGSTAESTANVQGAGTGAVNSSEAVIASVGTMSPEQVTKAVEVHERLDENMLQACRNPDTVGAALLGLIAQGNNAQWSDQAKAIADHLDSETIAMVKTFSELDVVAEQRLPLTEISIPAIKRLDQEQGKQLLTAASHLILADQTISSFEFFLYALLRKHIRKSAKQSSKSITSYRKVIDEIAYLVSIIAVAGGGYDAARMKQLMTSFTSDWQPPSEQPAFSAKKLDETLKHLNQLTPLLKRPLMLTLADIVVHDGHLKQTELELLRATGIYLECPIPPLTVEN